MIPDLCCPTCRGDLREVEGPDPELRCDTCRRSYPVILGIPDLRIFADPYIGLEEDRAKGRRLAEIARTADFAGVLAAYYAMSDTETSAAQARQFTAGLLAAPARAAAVFESWTQLEGDAHPETTRFAEIGCGTGPLLIAARRRFRDVIGVDIAFRWLVIARKRLADAGVDVPLICACAEALPLKSRTRDIVAGESAFEVTRDPRAALAEARRVLQPGGTLWLSTPNRHSLGPDPHVGVPAGGWWPRPLLDAFAKRRGMLPPQRDLQTAGSLRALLDEKGFRNIRLSLPDVPAAQRAGLGLPLAAAAAAYQVIKDVPGLDRLVMQVAPTLLATATSP